MFVEGTKKVFKKEMTVLAGHLRMGKFLKAERVNQVFWLRGRTEAKA